MKNPDTSRPDAEAVTHRASNRRQTATTNPQGNASREGIGEAHADKDPVPEGRRWALQGHCCDRCDKPLTGRKTRYCSDACRMADARDRQQQRRRELLSRIEFATAELRADLGLLR